MSNKVTIFLQPPTIAQYQAMLDNNIPSSLVSEYEVIETFTAKFEDGIEADIKICNSEDGIWIDPVLFKDGWEVQALDPEYELKGLYIFQYDNEDYIVEVDELPF